MASGLSSSSKSMADSSRLWIIMHRIGVPFTYRRTADGRMDNSPDTEPGQISAP
jgi:hypothetical protein